MTGEALKAWTDLYAGVALLAALCGLCAAAKTLWDIKTGHLDLRAHSLRGKLLLLPRIWFHWQLCYFTGFPCILAIAVLYAHYIGFSAFIPS